MREPLYLVAAVAPGDAEQHAEAGADLAGHPLPHPDTRADHALDDGLHRVGALEPIPVDAPSWPPAK